MILFALINLSWNGSASVSVKREPRHAAIGVQAPALRLGPTSLRVRRGQPIHLKVTWKNNSAGTLSIAPCGQEEFHWAKAHSKSGVGHDGIALSALIDHLTPTADDVVRLPRGCFFGYELDTLTAVSPGTYHVWLDGARQDVKGYTGGGLWAGKARSNIVTVVVR